jgi:hypothetical protein
MNVLFSTQSDSLRLFFELRTTLAPQLPIERAGFLVADSLAYARWQEEEPQFEQRGDLIIKEWEITSQQSTRPDTAKLARYERELGGAAGLFGAVVADRRLLMGADCTYSQDYRRRFTDDELLSILQAGLESTERAFDELRPSLLVGFICVTMLDYLAYLFARARGVRILNLRPTRIADRVTFGSMLNDPDPALVAAYQRIRTSGSATLSAAREVVAKTRADHARYEGVVRPSDQPSLAINVRDSLGKTAARFVSNYRRYHSTVSRHDNHVPNPLRALTFAAFVNPLRARATNRFLSARFIDERDLQGLRYAFFPLHTEPEVSLLVYGRPFVNQIEMIRALALSLPADMILVVKEHPWMVGKRTLGAYRKMLNIPRVRFVRSGLEARVVIQHASLVAVITGSIALEAAMLGKPVLTFGDCPYNLLPTTMVARVSDIRHLPAAMSQLLREYRLDDQALESYVAAVFETSASVNLYSVLLKKNKVHADRTSTYDEEIQRLAAYLMACTATTERAHADSQDTARW